MTNHPVLTALRWRYACLKFDSKRKISEATLSIILKAANLTATSFGLQAYKMILLEGEAWKEKLKPITFDQENIQSCSHVLVLCAYKDIDNAYINSYMRLIEEERKLSVGSMNEFADLCKSFIQQMNRADLEQWLIKQTYIVLGNLLNTCAMLEVDACPMEGFIPHKMDEVLRLDQYSLRSVLLFPMGYRLADDNLAKLKKVRKPLEEMVIRL